MKLLDLFCKAGGAGMGYSRAGFTVTGVDIEPQPRYPFTFIQSDAIEYLIEHGHEYDVIHASPPCQMYTRMYQGMLQSQGRDKTHPQLIEPTREILIKLGIPYVIENVMGAPLKNPIMLCGSSFNLSVQRHRLFESNLFLLGLPCAHGWQKIDKPNLYRLSKSKFSRVIGVYGHGRGKGDNVNVWRAAMGIDWMTRAELAQAIPPAYTEFIGRQIMQILENLLP